MPSITGVRLKPFGADATLLNLSASGVLVECLKRLRLGTAVTVVFDGTFPTSTIEGQVARSSVANVGQNGVLRYHVGIAFRNPMALEAALEKLTPVTAAAPVENEAKAAPVAPSAAPVPLVNRW